MLGGVEGSGAARIALLLLSLPLLLPISLCLGKDALNMEVWLFDKDELEWNLHPVKLPPEVHAIPMGATLTWANSCVWDFIYRLLDIIGG